MLEELRWAVEVATLSIKAAFWLAQGPGFNPQHLNELKKIFF